ncbi:MAG: TIGR04282 family arsenosugar biosynthesis glycosyltransferase [Robiginitalea sp.]|uniref:TIGR04282 family arsenosugar biosynthesis glycosyltransferase n=1 Tax=Robiginitalea sp. TaxID=1902411 RepID=UPI003C757088
MLKSSPRALLIFTRNPVPGKCKTRLAATIGDQAALDIYVFLLQHTASQCAGLPGVEKIVYFSDSIGDGAIWDADTFDYRLQQGADLGLRMQQAFKDAFTAGYREVIVIGSDLLDLSTSDLQNAFDLLSENEAVLGPAEDGGYYLLGLKKNIPGIFQNKTWGTKTVLQDTLNDLRNFKTAVLPARNDIDQYEDIAGNPVFEPFLKKIK